MLIRKTTKTTSVDPIERHENHLIQWRWRNLWEVPTFVTLGVEYYAKLKMHSVVLAHLFVVMIIIVVVGSLSRSTEGWMAWMRRRQRNVGLSENHERGSAPSPELNRC